MQNTFFTVLQAGEQVKGNITEQSIWEWNHSQTCTLLTNLKPTLESLLLKLYESPRRKDCIDYKKGRKARTGFTIKLKVQREAALGPEGEAEVVSTTAETWTETTGLFLLRSL